MAFGRTCTVRPLVESRQVAGWTSHSPRYFRLIEDDDGRFILRLERLLWRLASDDRRAAYSLLIVA